MEPDTLFFMLLMFFALAGLIKVVRSFIRSIVQGYHETMQTPIEKAKRLPDYLQASDGTRLEIIEDQPPEQQANIRRR